MSTDDTEHLGAPPGTILARGREILVLNHAHQWLTPGVINPMPGPTGDGWFVVRWGEGDTQDVEIPSHVSTVDLPPWEQRIWQMPGLNVQERQTAIYLIRLQRGDLEDDTEGLRRLYNAIALILDGPEQLGPRPV
ncbi:hypothetical protein [Actinomadura sp. GTD37]|uniref:hypothetical protein n=1 Tax=Actinomadura sp. GTD37 TaxID=1778030 RepID=UPI0035BF8009